MSTLQKNLTGVKKDPVGRGLTDQWFRRYLLFGFGFQIMCKPILKVYNTSIEKFTDVWDLYNMTYKFTSDQKKVAFTLISNI